MTTSADPLADDRLIYATVDEVIEILRRVSDAGKGDYLVG